MISHFGRKVIFVYPPESLNTHLIENIFKNEFEIYLMNSTEKLDRVLEIFSNSIVFFNIDMGKTHLEWIDTIKSIKKDPKHRDLTIGVFSKKDSKSIQDALLMDIGINAGYILLDKDQWQTVRQINQVLEVNEARGRRSRIRLDFDTHDKNDTLKANIYSTRGNLYKGEIKSFSALGMLVEIGKEHRNIVLRESIDKVIFFLDGRDHHVEGIHLDRISETDFFLKFKHISEYEREAVQSYIFNSLQKSFQKLLNSLELIYT